MFFSMNLFMTKNFLNLESKYNVYVQSLYCFLRFEI